MPALVRAVVRPNDIAHVHRLTFVIRLAFVQQRPPHIDTESRN
jgi:hypothetical protein